MLRKYIYILVVVNVKLSVGVSSPGSLEGNADKVFLQDIVENRATEATVLIKDLVDDVLKYKRSARVLSTEVFPVTHPAINLALISANFGGNVVLDNLGEGILILDIAHPAGQLRMPDGSVATDKLVICGSPLNKSVHALEVKAALGGLHSIPLATEL